MEIKMTQLVTVIVPVYNTGTYLEKCVQSLIRQTYTNLEIILINDGSTDNSLYILEKFSDIDPRVTVINKENAGVSSARNDGLRIASGSWISFVDSDDWIHPQYFEVLLNVAQQANADVVIGNHLRTAQRDVQNYELYADQISYKRVDINAIYRNRNMKSFVWGKLYKREVLNNHWFDEGISYGEDFLFNTKVFCEANTLNIVYIEDKIYFYYDRDGSVINTVGNLDKVKQGEAYIRASMKAFNKYEKMICLTEGIKRLLLARYLEQYTEKRKSVIKQCNMLLRISAGAMSRNREISMYERVVYSLFIYAPQLYRYYQIANDPTMKAWEKNQRNLRSNVTKLR